MKTKWFRNIGLAAMALSLTFGSVSAVSAASKLSGRIVINGSSALLPLTLQAANEFKKLNPKVKISASAAGSITGPQSVRKGIADIGALRLGCFHRRSGLQQIHGSSREQSSRYSFRGRNEQQRWRNEPDERPTVRYLLRQNHQLERSRRQ